MFSGNYPIFAGILRETNSRAAFRFIYNHLNPETQKRLNLINLMQANSLES